MKIKTNFYKIKFTNILLTRNSVHKNVIYEFSNYTIKSKRENEIIRNYLNEKRKVKQFCVTCSFKL